MTIASRHKSVVSLPNRSSRNRFCSFCSGCNRRSTAHRDPPGLAIIPWPAYPRLKYSPLTHVLGPLIGADLLHLRDLGRRGGGLMSIGGAGTFDGIVISGFLATMLST